MTTEQPSCFERWNTHLSTAVDQEVLGVPLRLAQDPNSENLGTTVWDASIVLAKYLEKNVRKGEFSRAKLRGKRVIELGSGMGLAGMAFAMLGAEVWLTDTKEILPMLRRNYENNLSPAACKARDSSSRPAVGRVHVQELDWLEPKQREAGKFDVVVATDCIYHERLLMPLLETVLALSHDKTTVVICNERRHEGVHQQFLEMFGQHYAVKKVSHNKMDEQYSHPDIELFLLRPRKAPKVATPTPLRVEAAEYLPLSQRITGQGDLASEAGAVPTGQDHLSGAEDQLASDTSTTSLPRTPPKEGLYMVDPGCGSPVSTLDVTVLTPSSNHSLCRPSSNASNGCEGEQPGQQKPAVECEKVESPSRRLVIQFGSLELTDEMADPREGAHSQEQGFTESSQGPGGQLRAPTTQWTSKLNPLAAEWHPPAYFMSSTCAAPFMEPWFQMPGAVSCSIPSCPAPPDHSAPGAPFLYPPAFPDYNGTSSGDSLQPQEVPFNYLSAGYPHEMAGTPWTQYAEQQGLYEAGVEGHPMHGDIHPCQPHQDESSSMGPSSYMPYTPVGVCDMGPMEGGYGYQGSACSAPSYYHQGGMVHYEQGTGEDMEARGYPCPPLYIPEGYPCDAGPPCVPCPPSSEVTAMTGQAGTGSTSSGLQVATGPPMLHYTEGPVTHPSHGLGEDYYCHIYPYPQPPSWFPCQDMEQNVAA